MATVSELTSKNIASAQANVQTWGNIVVNVKVYGAKGDGVTDDTIAIQSAITVTSALATAGSTVTLYFPSAIGYLTTSTITIPKGINVIMDAPIIYGGSTNEPALIIGTISQHNFSINLRLNVKRNTQSDWTSESCIGIKLINTNTSNVNIIQSDAFTIGCQFIGDGQGFVYNNITLGYILNNKYGIDLTNNNIGWCNENNYFGGRFTCNTGINTGISRYGVRVTSKETYINNNNIFYKPSFELQLSQAIPGEAIPILMEYGSMNHFEGCRSEGNSTTFAKITNNSTSNTYSTGYGSLLDMLDNQSAAPTDKFENGVKVAANVFNPIFNSGPMHKKACYYDGATSVNIPNVMLSSSSSSGVFNNASLITLNDNYLEVPSSRAIGIFVDTSIIKKFVVKRDVESTNGGRVAVRCYDASGTVLTDADPGHPYAKGTSYATLVYTTGYGGSYRIGSDNAMDIFLEVGNDVKSIAILITGGTNPCRVRSFSIHTIENGWCSNYTGYEEIIPGVNIGTSAPTAGTWAAGRRVVQSVPTVGQPKAWVCTVAGTPGTWVSEGNL